MTELRADALGIFRAALAALEPSALARRAAEKLPRGRETRLIAVGKAAVAMARGISEVRPLAARLTVTKDGHGEPALHAGHPVPDERSQAAGQAVLAAAAAATDLLVVALSGGASALVVAPAWGLTLAEKVAATGAVAAAGADIRTLNTVRKHLSALKGGRLALAARAEVVALVLSDVLGDDLATIGSGPVSPDPTTFGEALAIARAAPGVPPRVLDVLAAGARGELAETPKAPLAHVRAEVLAGPDDLVRAAAEAAAARGYAVTTETRVVGEAAAVGARLAEKAAKLAPGSAFVAGGEPTVKLPPKPGRGGRAQHVALAAAAHGLPPGAVVLAVGSDGTDGPTADAGGLVDAGTAARAGLPLADALARFDAGTALAAAGDLVTTGPTGNNLCDLFVVLTRP
jgi:glycerate 2-kinase